ncbi:MAG TPA: porin family protein [Sphingobacterium sp.]|nr:porin family protein [Sphingobacterium sp.]
MKKTILLLLGVILTIGLSAQDFKLGIKAGANFTTLKSNKKWLNSDNHSGYLIGGWARIGGGSIHLQPEVYFTNKQTSVYIRPEEAATDLVKGDLKFNNIDIPLLLGTKIPVGPLKLRVQAGPLFSFVIDKDTPYRESIDETYQEALKDYKDKFSSLVGGLGFDIGSFAVDVRYEYGLGNIKQYEDTKQSLNIWTIGLGYSFF